MCLQFLRDKRMNKEWLTEIRTLSNEHLICLTKLYVNYMSSVIEEEATLANFRDEMVSQVKEMIDQIDETYMRI